MNLRALLFSILIIGVTFFLTSCMVGPNFHSPRAPHVCRYTESPTPTKTVSIEGAGKAGKSQHFIAGETLPSAWWHLFHSPEINALICQGLANSPNLAAAKAALVQAEENYIAQVGTLYPSLTANGQLERQRFSAAEFGGSGAGAISSIFNLINANVGVTYTLDIFGGLRRQIEATGAQVCFEKYELDAAFLTLSSNIVTTSITIASLRAQIAATEELIQAQEKTLNIVKKQFNLGGASKADVLTQETQLGQLRATLPPLQQSLVQNQHSMSILIGQFPCEDAIPKLNLDKLNLPTNLPIGVPSRLVKQRPDIQAAEALLHAASAQIGVATANLYPQITVTGAYGWINTSVGGLFEPDNKVWNIAAAIAQPIFNGGMLEAKKRAAVAAYQQAAAQYQQTVLQAFQNVADTLRALQHDAELLKAQKNAENSAHRSLILTQAQFRLGGVNYLNLLTAERSYQQARIARIQAQASRYTDTAALFQALGGGWWRRPALNCDPQLNKNLERYRPECFG